MFVQTYTHIKHQKWTTLANRILPAVPDDGFITGTAGAAGGFGACDECEARSAVYTSYKLLLLRFLQKDLGIPILDVFKTY